MASFPDTIFRVAGYLSLDQHASGSAITVLESLENTGRFFTQEVTQGRITGFFSLEHDFTRTNNVNDADNEAVKIGSDPVYCFLYLGNVIFLPKDSLIGQLQELIRQKQIFGEPLLEAAFIIGDNELIDRLLDDRYFSIKTTDKSSSEFYLLNNLLRDRIVDQLSDSRLKNVMLNSRLSVNLDRVRVRFPVMTSDEEREILAGLIDARVRASKGLSSLGSSTVEFTTDAFLSVTELMVFIKLDLDYSEQFLHANGERRIFVPIGLFKLAGAKSGQSRELVQKAQHYLVGNSKRKIAEIIVGAVDGRIDSVNLQDAREVAVALMYSAQRVGETRFEEYGKLRCCTFAIRPLWYLKRTGRRDSNEVSDEVELLCIDAAFMRFGSTQFVVDIAFTDYTTFCDRGYSSADNFRYDLGFGLDGSSLAISIARKLDYVPK